MRPCNLGRHCAWKCLRPTKICVSQSCPHRSLRQAETGGTSGQVVLNAGSCRRLHRSVAQGCWRGGASDLIARLKRLEQHANIDFEMDPASNIPLACVLAVLVVLATVGPPALWHWYWKKRGQRRETTPPGPTVAVLRRLAWSGLVGVIFTVGPVFLCILFPPLLFVLLPGLIPGWVSALAHGNQGGAWSFFPAVDWPVAVVCNAVFYGWVAYRYLTSISKSPTPARTPPTPCPYHNG